MGWGPWFRMPFLEAVVLKFTQIKGRGWWAKRARKGLCVFGNWPIQKNPAAEKWVRCIVSPRNRVPPVPALENKGGCFPQEVGRLSADPKIFLRGFFFAQGKSSLKRNAPFAPSPPPVFPLGTPFAACPHPGVFFFELAGFFPTKASGQIQHGFAGFFFTPQKIFWGGGKFTGGRVLLPVGKRTNVCTLAEFW